ncbi:MAG: hypothetical protein AAGA50_31200, partial [Pseudomonadota bacterium]
AGLEACLVAAGLDADGLAVAVFDAEDFVAPGLAAAGLLVARDFALEALLAGLRAAAGFAAVLPVGFRDVFRVVFFGSPPLLSSVIFQTPVVLEAINRRPLHLRSGFTHRISPLAQKCTNCAFD